jgi:hypothetical protein
MAEEDEANFNPDEDIRNYEEVAGSLPVFCVSSRAYQKLSGRLQRDKDVPGFKLVEETEVCLATKTSQISRQRICLVLDILTTHRYRNFKNTARSLPKQAELPHAAVS